MPLQQALQLSQDQGLDLVAVAPTANPPVCRVLDYGKFKYDQTKKDRKAKQRQKATLLKEVRFRPRIDDHDLKVKMEKAREMLEDGSKVKIRVRFRGREIIYPDQGWKVLNKIAEAMNEISTVSAPISDGRNIALVLTPTSSKKPKEAKADAQIENS